MSQMSQQLELLRSRLPLLIGWLLWVIPQLWLSLPLHGYELARPSSTAKRTQAHADKQYRVSQLA